MSIFCKCAHTHTCRVRHKVLKVLCSFCVVNAHCSLQMCTHVFVCATCASHEHGLQRSVSLMITSLASKVCFCYCAGKKLMYLLSSPCTEGYLKQVFCSSIFFLLNRNLSHKNKSMYFCKHVHMCVCVSNLVIQS